jgi:hypothetical protein
MAFEDFTRQLLARAEEARDPGSADAYLRLTVAAEAMLKLTGICLLSEAVYRYGSEPAKKIISETVGGRAQGWGKVFEIVGRLPESALAQRISAAPSAADRVHELWTETDALLGRELGVVSVGVTKRKSVAWRHVLAFLPHVRNKVKGHGAPPPRLYPVLNPMLRELIDRALADLVAPIPPALAFVREMRPGQGLFLGLGAPVKEHELPIEVRTLQPGDMILAAEGGQIPLVPLVTYLEPTRALLLFNDSVAESTGELEYIDYLQGNVSRRPGHFVTRHGFVELAASETSATAVLRSGPGIHVPHNLPERRRGHVPRAELEAALQKLLLDDKHRIVSLDGRGGIGKTYLATEVCQRIALDPAAGSRFGFMLWMSARDVDLTAAGPKPVRQDLVTLEDVLRFVLRAYDPSVAVDGLGEAKLRAAFVETCEQLHPLLVLDNFETFAEPEKLHRFLDEHVPFQAKALITSRHRYFRGDFPLPVGGMSESESRDLIVHEARVRGVSAMFEAPDRVRRVYEMAQGHPYTMRLVVAQVAAGRSVYDACADVEKEAEVLTALFDRSLRLAQPDDVELATVLAALRTECPLEALFLLPMPKQDVEDAVGRLFNLSLLERIEEPLLQHPQYFCPRAAGEYIRSKRLLESPETRAKLERTVNGLRQTTQLMRSLAKKVRGGVKNGAQAADVMMGVARAAMKNEDHPVARRAAGVARDLAGDDAAILGEAAIVLKRAGAEPQEADALYGKALDLDPTNAGFWREWGSLKAQMNVPHGQVMACFERALEADPESREAAIEFVGAVLEVVKQEKKLGHGAVRVNDRRPARSLLVKARSVLQVHIPRTRARAERAELLGLQAWVVLQVDGLSTEFKDLVLEAEQLAPNSQQIRGLVQKLRKTEGEGGRSA